MTGRPDGFNKFGWMKALQSERAATATCAFFVGVHICIDRTRRDGTGWTFELDDIPPVGGKKLSRRTINTALHLLEDLGFITVLSWPTGGRGVKAKAVVNLRPRHVVGNGSDDQNPAVPTTGFTDENPAVTTTGFAENPAVPKRKPCRSNDKTLSFQRTKNPVEQHRYPPSGTSSGNTSGGRARPSAPTHARVREEPAASEPATLRDDPLEDDQSAEEPEPTSAAAPAAPPPRRSWVMGPYGPRCHRVEHFDDPDPPNCSGCGRAREAAKAEADADRAAIAADKAAIRAEITACTHCDDNGMTHGDNPRRCTRHRQLADARTAAS